MKKEQHCLRDSIWLCILKAISSLQVDRSTPPQFVSFPQSPESSLAFRSWLRTHGCPFSPGWTCFQSESRAGHENCNVFHSHLSLRKEYFSQSTIWLWPGATPPFGTKFCSSPKSSATHETHKTFEIVKNPASVYDQSVPRCKKHVQTPIHGKTIRKKKHDNVHRV